jgi:hypothetical protein
MLVGGLVGVPCRQEDEEALCVVCTDGTSVEPNKILFCERCDLAVHQHCYGLADIPEGKSQCVRCCCRL